MLLAGYTQKLERIERGVLSMYKNLKMKRLGSLILTLIILAGMMMPTNAVAAKENDYPIVLVNGFAGWGRDEALGFKYFGGLYDLQKVMTDAGYKTFTGTVAPFSSNWDRTCELYAYIKGGTVDYGEAHSAKYGHARYGRTFPGVYPSWGDTTDTQINKIHLVAHSMGAQTSRMLVQLLKEGSVEEQSSTSENLSPLFEGGKSWVISVTTLAGSNNGTTLADQGSLMELAKSMFTSAAALAGTGKELLYDFKLDQWGLKRNPGESFASYEERVFNSSLWKDTKDFSTWDLSTQGALEQNTWVKSHPDVYYFSWAVCSTKESILTGYSIPKATATKLYLYPFAYIMGSYTRNEQGSPIIDKKWFPSDGVVNTYSQAGPILGCSDEIIKYNGVAEKGKWNFMGQLSNMDHLGVVGNLRDMRYFYLDLATQLSSLSDN